MVSALCPGFRFLCVAYNIDTVIDAVMKDCPIVGVNDCG